MGSLEELGAWVPRSHRKPGVLGHPPPSRNGQSGAGREPAVGQADSSALQEWARSAAPSAAGDGDKELGEARIARDSFHQFDKSIPTQRNETQAIAR